MKRILLLATTTGYQTRMFGEAAERLGVTLVFATDRCDQLEDPWWDQAIPIRFHEEDASVRAIAQALERQPVEGVLAVGDRATVIAALVAGQLGLPGHPPLAAAAARDKRLTREHFRAARLLVPWFITAPATTDPATILPQLPWPVVVKPLVLSGSRGVMRANDPTEFTAAWQRLRRLLESSDVRAMRDPAARLIQVEAFIEGREYALEGLLHHGALQVLAIFDKPDPLDGPLFEETIYVTPSRADAATQDSIVDAVAAAARALGLYHGPIHAECRVNQRGVYVLEVAARPIGGLCARALQFVGADAARIGLEELLLRQALGEVPTEWHRVTAAAGVMMMPIPRAGVYRGVDGIDDATRVPGIDEVRITAKADQQLVPLPEGASYLGFIFASGQTPDFVEAALRAAHERLRFAIDRRVAMV